VLPAVPADERGEADDETDAPHAKDHQLGPAHMESIVAHVQEF
jgi:hypothetical protein